MLNMFGEKLHKILQVQKISGKELSQLTGIPQSTVSKFLSGDQEPRYSQIISISEAIQLPADAFMITTDLQPSINEPMINEYCMVRELFNDKRSHLHITSFYAFKEFTMEVPVINDEALYIVVVLEGGTNSKLSPLNADDFRIIKGIEYRGVKVTFQKGTKVILFIMHESLASLTKSLSETFFDFIEQQKKDF